MTYPVDMTIKPEVQAFFDEATNTISYIVKDPSSSACAIVDSVMDIDYAAGRICAQARCRPTRMAIRCSRCP